MPPMEQAKLWALRVVLRKQCEADDQFQWIAEQVHVVGEATQRDNPFVDSLNGLTRTQQLGTLGVPQRRRGARSK